METIPAEADPKLQERRDRLYDEISDQFKDVSFERLLDIIGELETFEDYCGDHPELFAGLAREAPCFTGGKMMKAVNNIHKIRTANYDCLNKSNEAAATSYFFQLHRKMEDMVDELEPAPASALGEAPTAVPRSPYGLEDHQSTPIPESELKADGVFFYERSAPDMAAVHMVMETKLAPAGSTINKDDLGQIADYVHAIWGAQPTRTFVPVLFAHGAELDLLVFTRDKWYRASLGPLSYRRQDPRERDAKAIRETMVRLWFILTLPPDRFGHFCDATKQPNGLLFTREEDSVMATVEVSSSPRYKGKKAVLKLAWVPVDRLPEGAVYEFLKSKNVGGIPEVFDSGILRKNFLGHRLEYLVLEHCGDPLDVYFHKL
ncbi:hypothetical protein LPJ61_003713, partial [Coemansia biformis]